MWTVTAWAVTIAWFSTISYAAYTCRSKGPSCWSFIAIIWRGSSTMKPRKYRSWKWNKIIYFYNEYVPRFKICCVSDIEKICLHNHVHQWLQQRLAGAGFLRLGALTSNDLVPIVLAHDLVHHLTGLVVRMTQHCLDWHRMWTPIDLINPSARRYRRAACTYSNCGDKSVLCGDEL